MTGNVSIVNISNIRKFVLTAAIIVAYFSFVAFRWGLEEGFFITLLTWSFFVLSTPLADAGFILDFPIRLVTGIRMWVTEVIVWIIAIAINVYAFIFMRETYSETIILRLLEHILEQPFPMWSIIIVSALGTFLSIYLGDSIIELWNHRNEKHRKNYRWIIGVFAFILIFILYDFLLIELGLPLL